MSIRTTRQRQYKKSNKFIKNKSTELSCNTWSDMGTNGAGYYINNPTDEYAVAYTASDCNYTTNGMTAMFWIRGPRNDTPDSVSGLFCKATPEGPSGSGRNCWVMEQQYSWMCVRIYGKHSIYVWDFIRHRHDGDLLDAAWHCWVMTYDANNNVYMYVDAVLETDPVIQNSDEDIEEMREEDDVPITFFTLDSDDLGGDGSWYPLRDCAIWDRNLTQSEITALYNSGNGANLAMLSTGSALRHWWKLGETDVFSNGHGESSINPVIRDYVADRGAQSFGMGSANSYTG